MNPEDKKLREEIFKMSDELQKLHNKCIQIAKVISARCEHKDAIETHRPFSDTTMHYCNDCNKEW
jgi:hypothetical protein